MVQAQGPRMLLVALEGIDGAGKTSQGQRLVHTLVAAGHRAILTAEPTPGLGQRIRDLAAAGERLAPEAELDLFIADRREHVRELIAPELQRGTVVVADRYVHSSIAYQGARGIPRHVVVRRHPREVPWPGLVLWLDLPVDVALDRIRARRPDAFERIEILEQVRRRYRAEYEAGGTRFVRVDADRPVHVVAADVWAAVARFVRP